MIKNTLTGKQKRFLRSLGMTLEPIVPIGKEGITPAVVNSADEAIEVAITTLAERTNCDLVQVIGRNGLLWRRNFKKPKIELPK